MIFALPCFAGEDSGGNVRAQIARKAIEVVKGSPRMAPRASSAMISDADVVRNGSSLRLVLAADRIIGPGDYLYIDYVQINFGGAETVAVAMDTDTENAKGGIGMLWSAPGESFTLTDAIPFDVITAARVPVYGPGLRLLVVNTGKSAMKVNQLTIYTCVR